MLLNSEIQWEFSVVLSPITNTFLFTPFPTVAAFTIKEDTFWAITCPS